jgi:cobalt/nickel transport system permease protein
MSFIEKNLKSLSEAVESTIFSEEFSKMDGFLQSLDPRCKILCFIAVLLAINLSVNLFFIFAIYLFLLLLAYFSKIPLRYLLKRVWFVLPFFTGLIALFAIFNISNPGRNIFTVLDLPRYRLHLYITDTGIFSALFLLFRVASSVSLAMLLVLTTAWNKILKSLDSFKLSSSFIIILLITYRYIFLLVKTANNMMLGRKSRIMGKPAYNENRILSGSVFGNLFNKTQNLSEEVHGSMRSRGFRDKVYIINDFRFSYRDYAVIIITYTILTVLYLFLK